MAIDGAEVRFDDVVEGKSLEDLSRSSGVPLRTLCRLRAGESKPLKLTRRALAEGLHAPAGITLVFPAEVAK